MRIYTGWVSTNLEGSASFVCEGLPSGVRHDDTSIWDGLTCGWGGGGG